MGNRAVLLAACWVGVAMAVGAIGGMVARSVWRQAVDVGIVPELIATIVVGIAGLIGVWVLTGRGPDIPPLPELMPRLALVGLVLVVAAGTFVVVGDDDVDEDSCRRVPTDDALEVMVVWTEEEKWDFCDVVAQYPQGEIEVTSTGPNIGAELTDRFEDGDPPDVAIIPQPSLVQRYGDLCRLLEPVNDIAQELVPHPGTNEPPAQRIPEQWNDLVTGSTVGGQAPVWGVFVKAANKSVFWHSTDALTGATRGEAAIWSWEEFEDWIHGYIEGQAVGPDDPAYIAPLALSAAEDAEWPLTDWFENQLVEEDPDLYQRFVQGDRVEWTSNSSDYQSLLDVLTTMTELWGREGMFAHGPGGVRQTALDELDDRLRDRDAALAFAASFLAGHVEQLNDDGVVSLFGFPGLSRRPPPSEEQALVVGGDVAVVPRQGSDSTAEAHAFVRWLAGPEAMDEWGRADTGFLAPNWESPYAVEGAENLRRLLTVQLLDTEPQDANDHNYYELFFDLSDDRFATRDEDDPRETWHIFQDFFLDVTRDPARPDAAERVIDRLETEYTHENDGPDCP